VAEETRGSGRLSGSIFSARPGSRGRLPRGAFDLHPGPASPAPVLRRQALRDHALKSRIFRSARVVEITYSLLEPSIRQMIGPSWVPWRTIPRFGGNAASTLV
jgi:hypothetical protein